MTTYLLSLASVWLCVRIHRHKGVYRAGAHLSARAEERQQA